MLPVKYSIRVPHFTPIQTVGQQLMFQILPSKAEIAFLDPGGGTVGEDDFLVHFHGEVSVLLCVELRNVGNWVSLFGLAARVAPQLEGAQ